MIPVTGRMPGRTEGNQMNILDKSYLKTGTAVAALVLLGGCTMIGNAYDGTVDFLFGGGEEDEVIVLDTVDGSMVEGTAEGAAEAN